MAIQAKNFDAFVKFASENYTEAYQQIRDNKHTTGGYAEANVEVEEKEGRFGFVSVRAKAEITQIRVNHKSQQEEAEAVIYPDGRVLRVF